jgi:serine/threonine protein kinase
MGLDLGSGSFSVVKQAVALHGAYKGTSFAVKCIRRTHLPPDEIDALRDEVSILGEVKHPNIIHMHAFYEEEEFYYLVMEVMAGGELFDRIVQKSFYNEKEARDLVKILLSSINYLHERNIVHRDLKPENLLLSNDHDDSDIRLADFGFAKRVIKPLSTQCGTPGYVAPEIIKGEDYGLGVDMWSIGVITYILLGGYPPFHDDNQAVLYKKIKSGDFVFHAEYWDPVSDEAKNLISAMLTVDMDKRMTAKEALNHPWISGMTDEDLMSHDLNGTLDEIKKFNARRKLKGTIKAVMAATKMKLLLSSLLKAKNTIEKEDAEEEAAALVAQERDKGLGDLSSVLKEVDADAGDDANDSAKEPAAAAPAA